MKWVIILGCIFGGIGLDISDAILKIDFDVWQEFYSVIRDIQFVGFAALAFELCPYRRVEFKMATFFMCAWRAFVVAVNLLEVDPGKAVWVTVGTLVLYLVWLFRALVMGHKLQAKEQPGAYMFLMPIHSVFGLLKAIFMPWEMARYESVVMVDDGSAWFVHGWRFTRESVCDTNLIDRPGVKVYLGRRLTEKEKAKFDNMVGKRAIPGVRDCRRLKIKQG